MKNTVLGHEFVGKIKEVGKAVKKFKIGDRVAVNCETFCGECFYCKKGYVNNCTDKDGVAELTEDRENMSVFPLEIIV